MTEPRAPYITDIDTQISQTGYDLASESARRLDDRIFADSIRRLLISIAELIRRRYGSEVLLIILKGK